MRNVIVGSVATGIVLLAGCSSIGGVSTTAATHGTTAAAADRSSTTSKPAHVGDTIVLKGERDGEQTDVTLVRVAASVKSSDDFETPTAGDRYYAAQFKIVNTGTADYNDSPTNGAKAADAQGQQFDPTYMSGISAGPLLPSDLKLAPGGTGLGWIVFQVPTSSTVSAVQFSMDSGFGGTGQWMIP